MTPQEKLEMWKALIPLFMGQLTLLLVGVIHAWASARGRQENRQQNQQLIKDVTEVKGAISGTGNGEECL